MTIYLDALQAAAETATPGPWAPGAARFDYDHNETHYVAPRFGARNICQVYSESAPADASFIAAANPAVVLELVAAHRSALARIARVEALLPKWGAERAKNAEMFSSGGIGMMTAIDYSGDLERALTEGEPDAG